MTKRSRRLEKLDGMDVFIYADGKTQSYTVYWCTHDREKAYTKWTEVLEGLEFDERVKIRSRIQRVINQTEASSQVDDIRVKPGQVRAYTAWAER